MTTRKISFKIVWSAAMTLIYVSIGYIAVFTPILIPYNALNDSATDQHFVMRMLFGGAVFVMGIARGYRAYKQLTN